MTINANQYLGDVCQRLADICATVSGINSTYATIPRLIVMSELPSVIVFPLAGTMKRMGGDRIMETRSFQVHLYFANAESGAEGERQNDYYNSNLLDLVNIQLWSRPQLELNDSGLVIASRVLGDDGIQMLQYPFNSNNAKHFIGSIINLQTDRTYSAPIVR